MEKPTILLSAGSGKFGSGELLFLDYLLSSGEKWFNPLIIFPSDGPLVTAYEKAGLETIIIPGLDYLTDSHEIWRQPLAWVYNLSSFMRVRRLIRKRNVRLVVSLSFINWTGALSARQEGIPHIWMIREVLSGEKTHLKFFWGKWLATRLANDLSVRVLLESSEVVKMFSHKRMRDKAMFLPPAINAEKFLRLLDGPPAPTYTSGEPVVGIFINDYDEKRIRLVLEAVGQALKKISADKGFMARAAIYFPGIERNKIDLLWSKLQLLVTDLNSGSELSSFLGDFSDFLSFPSSWKKLSVAIFIPGFDPLNRLLLEAGLSAIPTLVEAGAASELVIPGKTGFVFSAGNYQEIIAGLINVFSQEGLASSIGLEARKHIIQNYSLEDWRKHWEKIVEESLIGN